MGGLLALPALLGSAFSAIAERGTYYCFRYVCTYIYLIVFRRLNKRRFDLYDFLSDGEPEKNGFFIPLQEWQIERPRKNYLNKSADDVFFCGVSPKSDGLAVHVSRQPDGNVACSLLLRLQDGREFVLPEEHRFQRTIDEEGTFGSSRLKVQCLLPMRKWRIFFNGILKKHSKQATSAEYEHVKFTLIFTASSDAFDYASDMSKKLLSHAAASAINEPLPTTLKRTSDIFDSYEQSGVIVGTLNIATDNEREIYLWGCRGHYMGETKQLKKGDYTQIYGFLETGAALHLSRLRLPDDISRFSYGYFMRSDGFLHPVDELDESFLEQPQDHMKIPFTSDRMNLVVDVRTSSSPVSAFSKEFYGMSNIRCAEFDLNGVKGAGFIVTGSVRPRPISNIKAEDNNEDGSSALTVSFDEHSCQNAALTGGKGSSLGKLYVLSQETDGISDKGLPKFVVPKGIVVTTSAYELFTEGSLGENLRTFQKVVWSVSDMDSKELCNRMVDKVAAANLPNELAEGIERKLKEQFATQLNETKFAVRSSATGEDTEQMSAAGQMDTYLGLKDINEILEAIKKCWASQFAFTAVQYKRQYGQLLNSPMAVVIQEMVPCEVAGVAFTCDPLSGNPLYLSITANYGLGESVVSASAEPDTIVVERDLSDNVKFHSTQLGRKEKKIVMHGDSGTREIEVNEDMAYDCCLEEEMAVQIAQTAVKIEKFFGSPRDIEWGIIGNRIFLFQARPITSLDVITEFETAHIFDSPLRRENDYFSKANVGEVLPGATSPLGIDVFTKQFQMSYERQTFVRWDGSALPTAPYYSKRIVFSHSHALLGVIDGFIRFEDGASDLNQAVMYAVFGRRIDSEDIVSVAKERHAYDSKPGKTDIRRLLHIIYMIFTAGIHNRRLSKRLKSYKIQVRPKQTANQILNQIARKFDFTANVMNTHMYASIASSIWNMSILSLLAKEGGDWNNDVFNDFASVLKNCENVESADVPASIQNLSTTISRCVDHEAFKKMNVEDALKWLQTSNTEATREFKAFLKKHGHRCLKELDMFGISWEQDPTPLVKMLQNFVSHDIKSVETREAPSSGDIITNFQTKLGFLTKLKFRFLVPRCRQGVRGREFSKSLTVLAYGEVRKALHKLAESMVLEGYLPNKELLFFLSFDEIDQIFQTRSPRIVARALKRQRMHDKLDKYIFPELMSGIPQPMNLETDDVCPTTEGLTITGIPVSQGVVRGTARVVLNLSEANSIKPGDILIAYSTDVAWSPYFPLLSGVVTELGGLISHGAVVAREYGLPCVVGLHGATRAFKSGDQIFLDGNKGILKKLD